LRVHLLNRKNCPAREDLTAGEPCPVDNLFFQKEMSMAWKNLHTINTHYTLCTFR